MSTFLKNQSFYGDLDVPALDQIVKFGDVVEVDDPELVTSLVDGAHFVEVNADGSDLEKPADEGDEAPKTTTPNPETGTTTPETPAEPAQTPTDGTTPEAAATTPTETPDAPEAPAATETNA